MDNNDENLADNEENDQELNPEEVNIILELVGFNGNMFWENDDDQHEDDEVEIPEAERDHFDTVATASHSYLHANELPAEQATIEESESVQVPLIRQDIVVLPGQTVPLQTMLPADRQSIRLALDSKCYVALQTQIEPNHQHYINSNTDEELSIYGKVGTLLLLKQITDDGLQIKAVAVGKARCRFLKFERALTGALMATVKSFSGFTMPPLEDMICPNSLRKLTPKSKKRMIRFITSTPYTALPIISLKKHCDALANWMKLWYTEEQIEAELKQGPQIFSFWVAKGIPCALKDKYGYLEEECTNLRMVSLLKLVKSITLLVCSSCKTTISKIEKIIKMSIDGTSGHFVNNGGFIHEMLTVSEAARFNRKGRPSEEYSWFPGYKWQILECSMCNCHLGWEFTSKRLLPAKFYGLTRKTVVPQVEPQNDLVNE